MNQLHLKSILILLIFISFQNLNFGQKILQLEIISDTINSEIKDGKYFVEGKISDGKYIINEVYIESTSGKWAETDKLGLFKIELDTSDKEIVFKKKGYETFVFKPEFISNQQHYNLNIKTEKGEK